MLTAQLLTPECRDIQQQEQQQQEEHGAAVPSSQATNHFASPARYEGCEAKGSEGKRTPNFGTEFMSTCNIIFFLCNWGSAGPGGGAGVGRHVWVWGVFVLFYWLGWVGLGWLWGLVGVVWCGVVVWWWDTRLVSSRLAWPGLIVATGHVDLCASYRQVGVREALACIGRERFLGDDVEFLWDVRGLGVVIWFGLVGR